MKKSDLDKFYTKDNIALLCIEKVKLLYNLEDYQIIEPSAGAGAFSKKLNCIALDIEPEDSTIQQLDFFNFKIATRALVIGNPPFGKNSSLAKKFFNHSATFADVIAFILPKTFRKVSIQNALNLYFHLQNDIDLPNDSFLLDGKSYSVNVCFQIWEKRAEKRNKIILKTNHPDIIWTDKENASFSMRRVGALAGKINKNLDYAASSNYFIKGSEELFDKLDSLFKEFNSCASNAAGNPSLGKGEIIQIYEKYYG